MGSHYFNRRAFPSWRYDDAELEFENILIQNRLRAMLFWMENAAGYADAWRHIDFLHQNLIKHLESIKRTTENSHQDASRLRALLAALTTCGAREHFPVYQIAELAKVTLPSREAMAEPWWVLERGLRRIEPFHRAM